MLIPFSTFIWKTNCVCPGVLLASAPALWDQLIGACFRGIGSALCRDALRVLCSTDVSLLRATVKRFLRWSLPSLSRCVHSASLTHTRYCMAINGVPSTPLAASLRSAFHALSLFFPLKPANAFLGVSSTIAESVSLRCARVVCVCVHALSGRRSGVRHPSLPRMQCNHLPPSPAPRHPDAGLSLGQWVSPSRERRVFGGWGATENPSL